MALGRRLSPHFTKAELGCRCGCGLVPPQAFVHELERLRATWGHPIVVNSCARCPAYNAEVYRRKDPIYTAAERYGPHTPQLDPDAEWGAVDIKVFGARALDLTVAARQLGWTGVGWKQHGPQHERFVHLDRLPNAAERPRRWAWSY